LTPDEGVEGDGVIQILSPRRSDVIELICNEKEPDGTVIVLCGEHGVFRGR
jgi:hypothetical protein